MNKKLGERLKRLERQLGQVRDIEIVKPDWLLEIEEQGRREREAKARLEPEATGQADRPRAEGEEPGQ
jgi:hypothetical protein